MKFSVNNRFNKRTSGWPIGGIKSGVLSYSDICNMEQDVTIPARPLFHDS